MGIMDIFQGFRQGEGKTAAQQQPPAIPNDPTKQVGPGNTGNQTVPGAATVKSDGTLAAIPASGTGEASPLGKFDDLWQRKDTDAKPVGFTAPLAPDLGKVQAAASNADFVSKIDPALLSAAAKGDTTALAKVINTAAQAGFTESAMTTAQIVNNALADVHRKYETEYIPAILRKNNVSQAVADLPMAQHPAVSPVVDMVRNQLMIKNPTATPEQIANLTREYMADMSRGIIQASGQQVSDIPKPAAGARTDTDWEKYFA